MGKKVILNEVKPIQNINKNSLGFLKINFIQKKVFTSIKTAKLLTIIESSKFVSDNAKISREFDSRIDKHSMQSE